MVIIMMAFKLVRIFFFEGDYSDNPILETVYKLSYQSYFQTLRPNLQTYGWRIRNCF